MEAINEIRVTEEHKKWIDAHLDSYPQSIVDCLTTYKTNEDSARRARIYLRLVYLHQLLEGKIPGEDIVIERNRSALLQALLHEPPFREKLLADLDAQAAALANPDRNSDSR